VPSPHQLRSGAPARLAPLGGLALILGGALSIAGGVLHPVIEHESHSIAAATQPAFPLAHLLLLIGGALLLIGLPAFYARIAPRTPILGLVGFAVCALGNAAFIVPFAFYETVIIPTLAADPMTQAIVAPGGMLSSSLAFTLFQGLGAPLYLLGMLVLGIAAVRSRAVPTWAGVLLALAPIIVMVPVPETPVLTGLLIELPRGLAVVGVGWSLLAGEAPAARPRPSPAGATPPGPSRPLAAAVEQGSPVA
jgi:hypothetical protein